MNGRALFLMDYEAGICGPQGMAGAEVARREVLPRAKRCLRAARDAKMNIYHIRVAFDEQYSLRTNRSKRFTGMQERGALLLGSPDAAICEDVAPIPGEPIITKGCVNPFIGTALVELLIGERIGELYLGGVATNFVVESTLRHAVDSGFRVTVIEDICASFSREMHDFAITNIFPAFAELCSADEFITAAANA